MCYNNIHSVVAELSNHKFIMLHIWLRQHNTHCSLTARSDITLMFLWSCQVCHICCSGIYSTYHHDSYSVTLSGVWPSNTFLTFQVSDITTLIFLHCHGYEIIIPGLEHHNVLFTSCKDLSIIQSAGSLQSCTHIIFMCITFLCAGRQELEVGVNVS